jgi:hypothetical protein
VARDTYWASMADRHPDRCPMEGGWTPIGGGQVPNGEREWPNGGYDGCPTEGESRGWPDGGLYKCCWPSFLGTLHQRLVSLARNAGAQGANK